MAESIAASFILTAKDETGAAFTSASERLTGLAERVIAFGAAYLTLEKVSESIEASFDRIEKTAMVAEKIGTTTQALAGMEALAQRNGLAVDSMDTAIEKMTKNIGAAEARMGSALPWFQRWNIDIEQFAKLDAAKQFEAIADHIGKLPNAAAQAKAAVDIMGRSGMDLIPIMHRGAEGAAEAAEQTKAWGYALNDLDTARVLDAKEHLEAAKQAVEGLSNRVTAMLSPYMRQLAEDFTNASTKTQGFKGQVGELDQILENTVAWVADIGHSISVLWAGLQALFADIAAGIMTVIGVLSEAILKPFVMLEEAGNKIIAVINKISGTHIEPIKFFENKEIDTLGGLGSYFDRAREKHKEFSDSLNQPMPSDAIHAWFQKARTEADSAAKDIQAKMHPPGGAGGSIGFTPEEIAKFQSQLSSIEGWTGDAVMKVEAEAAKQKAALDALMQSGYISKQRYAQLEEQLEVKKQQMIAEAAKKGELQRQTFQRLSLDLQISNVAGALEQMTSSVASSNMAMFRINQAAGIANAVINTAQGVTKALASYPPPLSFVMAAVQLAAGLAQIDAIKNAQFGGGSVPSVGGGAVPTVDDNPVPTANTETIVPGGRGQANGKGTTINFYDQKTIDGRGTTAGDEMRLRELVKAASDDAVMRVNDLARNGKLGS